MPSEPDLTVDGVTFEMQSVGGISQIFRECLPRICDAGASGTICTASALHQPIPIHQRLKHLHIDAFGTIMRPEGRRIPVASRVRRHHLGRYLRDRYSTIWQSTYYTMPPRGWRGAQVVLVADLIYELFPQILRTGGDASFRSQKRRCIEAADAIICISETTKADLLRLFRLGTIPVHVVHLAARDTYQEEPVDPLNAEDDHFFLYIGGRDSYKNFRLVLDAFALWKAPPHIKLRVAGSPFTKRELAEIAKRGLTDIVQHIGRPSDRELARLYSKALAFIYPSLYEGFGIPLVEAMARKCPIIASDIPSTREVAGRFACYFDPHDAGTLAGQLQDLSDSPPPFVDAAVSRSRQFSWRQTADKVYEIYRRL